MRSLRIFSISCAVMLAGIFSLLAAPLFTPAYAAPDLQQPTVSIATVTGTPMGAYIIVDPSHVQVNVRSGPGTDYPTVGVLVGGEQVPAKGRSVAGEWIQVFYPAVAEGVAWVYAPLVALFGTAQLGIIEPPPTPTPRVTPTIDPTLAAQFLLEIPATRMPTFTPPEPLEIPEFEQAGTGRVGGVPVGMLITGVGLMGLFAAAVSYLRER
ncbi:MAG: SH3 domain-containing protein [Anaerolineales bacterium]|nr:SH3 domain-containing protein [Anaerolineales bacterium]